MWVMSSAAQAKLRLFRRQTQPTQPDSISTNRLADSLAGIPAAIEGWLLRGGGKTCGCQQYAVVREPDFDNLAPNTHRVRVLAERDHKTHSVRLQFGILKPFGSIVLSLRLLQARQLIMALQGHDDELLKQSLNRAEEYPSNLVRTEAFPHVLSAYRSKLDADVTQVFQPEKSNVVIWDLAKSGDG